MAPDDLADVFRRLERIEDKQVTMLSQLAAIMERQETSATEAAAILAEVGGVPTREARGARPPLRDRVHTLESDAAAAKIAQKALDLHRQSVQQAWSQKQKAALFVFAGLGAVEGLLRLIGVGG